ncbi:hypothetical protein PVNG_05345 [Plasmodium vivax North Korean]|uniref:Uncharacterized protein n=1 Tax=Plasmodium vivax North Korean TaxID=1035514 RepID=A0A0J9TYW2_PLAVI|nr:hypothetical protein PVNG_05345 [Plasmodium vivax North Korean]
MSEGINKEKVIKNILQKIYFIIYTNFDSYKEYALNKSVLWNHILPLVSEFSNFPDSIISRDIQNRDYVIKNCIRLKNYLSYFKTNKLCEDNKCCGYFNFWLNENARKDESINEITSSHYKNCINYYSDLIESNKCISEIYYIKDSEFEKKQGLYDLYDYYNDIKQIAGDYNKCSFFNNCAHKYNDIIGKCKDVTDDDFCTELINFGNNFLKKILTSDEQCEEEIVKLLSPEDAMIKLQEEQQQAPLLPLQEEVETVKVAHGPVGLGDVAVVESDRGAGESAVMPSASAEPEKIPGDRVSEIFVEQNNSNTPKPIGTIIGTSFGFFIPLTMLYKEDQYIFSSIITYCCIMNIRRSNIIKIMIHFSIMFLNISLKGELYYKFIKKLL